MPSRPGGRLWPAHLKTLAGAGRRLVGPGHHAARGRATWSSLVAVPHGGEWHTRITAVERLGCSLSPSTIPASTWNRDASGLVARAAFPPAVGPKDRIGRFREGIRRPKVAAAFQADPELIGLPGFPGTWICEIHERAATLAAHLKVDISHEPHSSVSGGDPPALPGRHPEFDSSGSGMRNSLS